MTKPYAHPLSEVSRDRKTMDFWAAASLFANVATGRKPTSATPRIREACKSAIVAQYPLLDANKLLDLARTDDAALLQIINAIQAHLQRQADEKFGNG